MIPYICIALVFWGFLLIIAGISMTLFFILLALTGVLIVATVL